MKIKSSLLLYFAVVLSHIDSFASDERQQNHFVEGHQMIPNNDTQYTTLEVDDLKNNKTTEIFNIQIQKQLVSFLLISFQKFASCIELHLQHLSGRLK
jgi:hypothetical protein